ncbi:MAG: cell division protein FtsZ [Ferrovum sp. 37-45-19]|jgi:cell division protein FtsZ|uniref:cell division protein FtsZ n=1 Tax=Ferrovum sp. JA12 TaxID=1356299 RepID=UPI000703C1F1|nr:cell division protein FtsZ [Ferrovum sp. JA12]OYV80652.1 MAG: cell division protein FtsZ [Ferrovum sp. 21-44-67]OYV95203.1 MAG: cell division protein FtsZ [Ferrovum sp. 37-45-19]HQT80705.1 cell division protein FtsZ [Ferrovaceae bacterium]KRH79798.1 cell division protein FtsZ [Ferrovum sp. JA12]HQU05915.1 cell division protein FtsZ [Ferrovaceae bacterium]
MPSFEILENQALEAVIKVIGVGGCGGNAVEHMVSRGVSGVEFIAMNTDSQALKRSKATHLLQLGQSITKGLGAGANPEVGRQAALADRERIAEMIQGADMLFITAGMGGGTGTGAAPVVAEIARELGVLTVAVVTKPFDFEGKRMKAALDGITQLAQNVDSLIIIPNAKLMDVLGEDITMLEAYEAANDVLKGAVAGIAEVINCPGLVNVDFADVKTVMSEMGVAMMGSAMAAGIDRAHIAAQQAIASPLLEDVNLAGARGVLVNITAGTNMKLKEVHDVMNTIRSFTADDATVIFGSVVDETIGDSLRVTIVATGLGEPVKRMQTPPIRIVMTGTDGNPIDEEYDTPIRRGRSSTVDALKETGMDVYDIPAFLRKQAD